MSYCFELKKYIYSVENKSECCEKAFEAGLKAEEFERVCERDINAYLRGLFVSFGNMSDPEKQYLVSFSGNHLDVIIKSLNECGFYPLETLRKGKRIIYFREGDTIVDFLTAIGASKYSLDFLSINVIKQTKREENRKNNADFANVKKAISASVEVCEAIKTLKNNKQFETLPEALKETAELRLNNPELTLEELRSLHKEPISKSGLNHRLKRLIDAANCKM